MKNLFLFVLLSLLLPMTASANPVKIGDLWYNLNDESHTAEVCSSLDGTSYSGSIVIPETVEGYTVTSIGWWAFSECRSLTSVVMPETITSIGEGAFWRCSNLTSINYESGINHIPNNVSFIGWVAFEGCGISSITLPTSLSYIDGRMFSECPLTSIYIPANITSIHPEAFRGCPYITSIKVDPLNEYYDSRNNCNAIIQTSNNELNTGCENTIIPDGIEKIAGDAFAGRVGLTAINIPSSVTAIAAGSLDGTFSNCTSLERVDITDLEAWCNIVFANGDSNPLRSAGKLYLNGTRITALTIPTSVTEIKNYAFIGGKFTSLTIPNTVIRIGEAAFSGCSTLRTAKVSNIENGCNLTAIEHDAFCDCSALQSVNFTEYVTELGEASFARCGSLTEVELNDNLTTILPLTFLECENLTTINIPNSITSICESAFEACHSLSIELVLPEGLTTIGNRAFVNCHKLATLNLPNTLTTIGDEAFAGASSLPSLYIPSCVKSIGEKAFVGLINATSIIVDEDNTKYDSRGYCNALIETRSGKLLAGCQNTIIPDGVSSIENAALAWLPNTFFIVPDSVGEIKEGAFAEANINGDYWTFKTLVLGSGITDIGPYICNGGGFPLDVYCYATSVPITDGAAFDWGYTSPGPGMGTLHVPAESIEEYKTTAPWSNFSDYVPITGDEHFAEIDVVIGPSGYATFSYGYALDFTGIEGLTAYVAKGNKSELTYEAVGKVPGRTGLLLAGNEGTYKVPVILSANAIPGNLLVGTVVRYSTTLADGDYLLQNDPTDGIGFYQGAGKTLGAGKAYLHVDDASGVKSFTLPKDDATSIQGIEISQENSLSDAMDNAVYNLAGQRVLKPGRGLYIMGGKKIVIK